MNRHVRQYCKIANSAEGMEKLMEHTIRRQLMEQQHQLAEQNAKIERLTALLERQLAPQGATTAESDAGLAIATNHGHVYLNPHRADQVLVYDETWNVLSLADGIRTLFDSVAGKIQKIIVTDKERAQLPMDVQATASWIPTLYKGDQDGCVQRARPQMSAHLTNVRELVPELSPAAEQ